MVHVDKLLLHRVDLLLQRAQLIALYLGGMIPLLFFSFKVKHQVLDLSNILDCYESSQPFELLDNRTKDLPVTSVFFQYSFHPFITRRLEEVLGKYWFLIDLSIFSLGILGGSTSPCF